MPEETKKLVTKLTNCVTGIMGSVEIAAEASLAHEDVKAKKFWHLALEQCRAAVLILAEIRARVMTLRRVRGKHEN